MNFIQPFFLILLCVVPVMALFLIFRGQARAAALNRIGDVELVKLLVSQISPVRRRWKAMLWLLTLVALILALARPTWGAELQKVEKNGVAIMVVLDVSRSMDAQDILPSRLERAKLDLHDLFGGLEGNDVGIILFTSKAVKYMPLTNDLEVAQVFLNAASTSAISAQGTAIGDALQLALDSFDDRITGQPVIILVSDGENHEGDPLVVVRTAADQGIVIHTLGYGTTEGAVIPLYDAAGNLVDYKTDSAGNLVETRLNSDLLQQIADITGGSYQPFDNRGTAIQHLLSVIGKASVGQLQDEFITRPVERFGIFAALALLALSLEILLPEVRRNTAL